MAFETDDPGTGGTDATARNINSIPSTAGEDFEEGQDIYLKSQLPPSWSGDSTVKGTVLKITPEDVEGEVLVKFPQSNSPVKIRKEFLSSEPNVQYVKTGNNRGEGKDDDQNRGNLPILSYPIL